MISGRSVNPIATIFKLHTFMDKQGRISPIVDNLIRTGSIWPGKSIPGAVPIIFEGFTFPGKHRNSSSGNSRSSMILGRKDIARAPANISTKLYQSFNQHRGLDGHVQGSHNLNSSQWFGWTILCTGCHETGHFMLGNGDFFTTKFCESDICNFVVEGYGGDGFCHSSHGL